MSDWNLPDLTDIYADFLDDLKDRDFDAISLGYSTITNPQTGMMRYVRADNKFQEYSAGVWGDKLLALAGGGTGAATAANARTNLGLGTISTQDSNNVTITGGSISGLSSLGVSGISTVQKLVTTGTGADSATIGGGLTIGTGAVALVNTAGKITAISSTYFASLDGSALTGLNGSNIASGTINVVRLGSGATAAKFLRGDNTWQSPITINGPYSGTIPAGAGSPLVDITVTSTAAPYAIIPAGSYSKYGGSTFGYQSVEFSLTSATNVRVTGGSADSNGTDCAVSFYILQG